MTALSNPTELKMRVCKHFSKHPRSSYLTLISAPSVVDARGRIASKSLVLFMRMLVGRSFVTCHRQLTILRSTFGPLFPAQTLRQILPTTHFGGLVWSLLSSSCHCISIGREFFCLRVLRFYWMLKCLPTAPLLWIVAPSLVL